MFNIYLGIYIVASLAIVGGGTKKLYDLEQSVGAFIFFAGSVSICVIYGLRWFGAANALFAKTPVQWPPRTNKCPDYLTYYQRTKNGKQVDTCIDLIGVATNASLKTFPSDGTIPEDDGYYFDLTTTTSDPSDKNLELCNKAMTAGLTWEGITNGEGCITANGVVGRGGTPGSPAGCPK